MSRSLTPHTLLGVLAETPDHNNLITYGETVPGAVAGYHTGAIFIHTDGTAATAAYINVGDKDAADFVALPEKPVGSTTEGLIVVGGSLALDGGNPTPVVTGLTAVLSFTATLQGAVAPGDGTSVLTHAISGGTVSVYAWTNTTGTDPTLVASTGTETFSWIAIGTM